MFIKQVVGGLPGLSKNGAGIGRDRNKAGGVVWRQGKKGLTV
jgi:hypothetical protein